MMNVVLPPGCVTGVGSLPFTDPREAIQFVAEYSPIIPFWPQLPKRHPAEVMIAQGLGPLGAHLKPAASQFSWQLPDGVEEDFGAALDSSDAGLVPATAAGFFALESAVCRGEFPRAIAVKAQSIGPATLAFCVLNQGQPLASRRGWLHRFATFLARGAVWQVRRLQALGLPVIFALDEPAMGFAHATAPSAHTKEIAAAINHVLVAAAEAGAVVGIHCCSPLPLALMKCLDLDLVSFDAHLPMEGGSWIEYAQSLLDKGARLAFGLVPTDPNSSPNVPELFDDWLRLSSADLDVRRVASQTLVTATCGLGLSTPAHAAVVFESCRHLGDRIALLG